jgi:ribosomal protein S18 acetylase RimI-like enzyme
VGVLVVTPDDEPGQLCISTLVVQASAQRQGVGRSLVLDALQRGPGVVFAVSAATANVAAMGLYHGLGFTAYRHGVLGAAQLPVTKLRRVADDTGRSAAAPGP